MAKVSQSQVKPIKNNVVDLIEKEQKKDGPAEENKRRREKDQGGHHLFYIEEQRIHRDCASNIVLSCA